jgi:hypothetical protein
MIHIINRHCKSSNLSINKARPTYFSREACFKNLTETISSYKNTEHHILFDGDPTGHFLENNKNLIRLNSGSGAKSFVDAVNYAISITSNDEDIIYFVEDDYLHAPMWPPVLEDGFSIEDNSYISLYDHNDKYYRTLNPSIKPTYENMYKDLKSEIAVTLTCHWRTVSSTTDTFAIKRKDLIKYKDVFTYFSSIATHSLDHERGLWFTKNNFKLWTCMPGYATHMEPDYMSPIFDWQYIQHYTT